MTTLSGIKDAQYLAQFLGNKIAIRDADDPKKVTIYPELSAIFANKTVTVWDKKENWFFDWARCENPYVVLFEPGITVEMK